MLPKSNRIPSQELKNVLRYGKRVTDTGIELKIQKNTVGLIRCAIVVPTRFDKRATKRNRIRRLISESVRLRLPNLSKGNDLAFLVKGRMPDTQQDVDALIVRLLESIVDHEKQNITVS